MPTVASKKSGGRPSREQAVQIEERILQIAEALFLSQGYGATSIESVVQLAGIAKRTFYHRFPDKAALFAAVIHRLIARLKPASTDRLFTGSTLEELLRQLAHIILYAAISREAIALHRIMVSEAEHFPELAAMMHAEGARTEAIRRIAALLEREIGAKHLPVAPHVAAQQFMQMVVSIPQRSALGLLPPMTLAEMEAWADDAVVLFIHGCGR